MPTVDERPFRCCTCPGLSLIPLGSIDGRRRAPASSRRCAPPAPSAHPGPLILTAVIRVVHRRARSQSEVGGDLASKTVDLLCSQQSAPSQASCSPTRGDRNMPRKAARRVLSPSSPAPSVPLRPQAPHLDDGRRVFHTEDTGTVINRYVFEGYSFRSDDVPDRCGRRHAGQTRVRPCLRLNPARGIA